MGLVQYQNWGNALSTLHTGTCYLSARVYACTCVSVCVCVCVFHHPEVFACSGSRRGKVPLNDFTVFTAVAEPSLNILYCIYCRIKLISVKKVLQRVIARLFYATCNIKRRWNWIFLDFVLGKEQNHSSNFPGKQWNCRILMEIIIWIVEQVLEQ